MKELMVVVLLVGLLVGSFSTKTLYVRPNAMPRDDCPTNGPCETVDDYRDNSGIYFEGDEIKLIFLPGSYDSSIEEGIKISHIKTLLIQGSEGKVAFNLIEMLFFSIDNVTISGLTISEVDLYVYIAGKVSVVNCIFMQSVVNLDLTNAEIQNCHFMNYHNHIYRYYERTALELISSNITFIGTNSFSNNTGNKGGAISMENSKLIIKGNAVIQFQNNRAEKFGGAIFVKNEDFCFYEVHQLNATSKLVFDNNKAVAGGDNIFGASLMSNCTIFTIKTQQNFSSQVWRNHFVFTDTSPSLSLVSAQPKRVCLCDNSGRPQCTKMEYILLLNETAFPGEVLNLPIVLVGGDFGTTIGTVYLSDSEFDQNRARLASTEREFQVLQNKQCTLLKFTLFNKSKFTIQHKIILHMSTTSSVLRFEIDDRKSQHVQWILDRYDQQHEIDTELRNLEVFMKIHIDKCPLGFTYDQNTLSEKRCDCYRNFKQFNRDMECIAQKGTGYISWEINAWVMITDIDNQTGGILISRQCPSSKCLPGAKQIDVINNPNSQCAFNHTGWLCGGCEENFSLAIGSSRCLYCPNNNNLALLLFFAAAGFLLVLMISILNLTVTQGVINGLIFYANIVRVYGYSYTPGGMLNIFIAWLNLDFGIETCFYRGLNSFTAKWLQMAFPFYVAALFFLGVKFSDKLAKICGNRSVPTLATIIFLSYIKLLNIITASLRLETITTYSENTIISTKVWAEDGRLQYGHHPHIYLLITSLIFLVFLWIPYTLLLLLMQWLRAIDHYRPLKMIAHYKPVYDAYFAPLKDKHHYWFGTLLLARGAVFLISSLTQSYGNTSFSMYVLITVLVLILVYLNYAQVYKRISIAIIESSFLVNLILLFTGISFFRNKSAILFNVSIGFAFIEFCGIVIWNILPQKIKSVFVKKAAMDSDVNLTQTTDISLHTNEDCTGFETKYRDSILN